MSGRLMVLLVTAIFFVTACGDSDSIAEKPVSMFDHEFETGNSPWTNKPFDAAADKFTFAVHSDLTGGERERIFEVAMAQAALLRPEFIIGVGDLIEGGSDDRAQLASEWDSFDRRASTAKAPVFKVGGNHDLTSVVMQQVWDERYGRRYYHFVYKNVLFMVLDTEDNLPERVEEIFVARSRALKEVDEKGWEVFDDTDYAHMPEQTVGNISAEQSAYFQQAIADNADVAWTFLFMHKAAWEKENEQNFAAVEAALSEQPYTLFHGHLHSYNYQQRHGRDYIRLATTGGVQSVDGGLSVDHLTLVTVSNDGVDIANIKLSGILDKTGKIPLDGGGLCFQMSTCGSTK